MNRNKNKNNTNKNQNKKKIRKKNVFRCYDTNTAYVGECEYGCECARAQVFMSSNMSVVWKKQKQNEIWKNQHEAFL